MSASTSGRAGCRPNASWRTNRSRPLLPEWALPFVRLGYNLAADGHNRVPAGAGDHGRRPVTTAGAGPGASAADRERRVSLVRIFLRRARHGA
jgi:hypothetical protein